MFKKSTAAILMSVLVFTPACDQMKKLDNMNNNTSEMNAKMTALNDRMGAGMDKTTNGLDKTVTVSEGLSGKMDKTVSLSEDLRGTSNQIYDKGRLGGSSNDRRNLINQIKTARSMKDKVVNAVKYMISFEYQLFSNDGLDKSTPNRREVLMAEAVEEFLVDISQFRIWSTPVDPFAARMVERNENMNPEEEENLDASFSAIASSLHLINRVQLEFVKDNNGLQAESMLSLIVQGLQSGPDVDSGKVKNESLPLWKRKVLENKNMALQLLQARHNMLAMIALSKVLPPDDLGRDGNKCYVKEICFQGIKQFLTAKDIFSFNYDFDMSKYGMNELESINEFLKLTVETRDILKIKLGIKPEINAGVNNFIKGLKVKPSDKQNTQVAQVAAVQTSIVGLLGRLKQ